MTNPVESDALFTTRFLELRRTQEWVFAHRPNARAVVCILAITPEDRIVLVEQFRKPIGKRLLELPAGLVGDGDDAQEALELAANRELIEESGWSASQLDHLWTGPSSAGLTDETITCFKASKLTKVGTGGGVDGEDIQVHEIPLNGLSSWLGWREEEGVGVDPKIYAALWKAGIRS
jgi:ADP-ribose pyrophosphatase